MMGTPAKATHTRRTNEGWRDRWKRLTGVYPPGIRITSSGVIVTDAKSRLGAALSVQPRDLVV